MVVGLSFYARSRVAILLLRWSGGYFFVAMAMSVFMGLDCTFDDYAFQNCHFIPQVIGDVFLLPHVINLFLLALAAPIWALVLGSELGKRRGGSRATDRKD